MLVLTVLKILPVIMLKIRQRVIEKKQDTLPGTGPGHEKKQMTSVDVSRYFEPKSDKWKRFNKSNYKNRNNNYRRSDPDSYDNGFTYYRL